MKIAVTQAHIDQGENCNAHSCPVALALTELGMPCVAVSYAGIEINGNKYPLPESVRDFIETFDSAMAVKPFEFELPI